MEKNGIEFERIEKCCTDWKMTQKIPNNFNGLQLIWDENFENLKVLKSIENN